MGGSSSKMEKLQPEVNRKNAMEVEVEEKWKEQLRVMEEKMEKLQESLEEKDNTLKATKRKLEVKDLEMKIASKKLRSVGAVENVEEEARKSLEENTDGHSWLLEYLPKLRATGAAGLILEHVVAGEGGVQAILNLRKVHPDTKEWVDNLPPSQSDRIFTRIPIKFNLSLKNLQKFNYSPPPPPAMSMIFDIGSEWKPFASSEEMQSTLLEAKEDYPAFFSFWNSRLKILQLACGKRLYEFLRSVGLDILGTPSALRNLDTKEYSGLCPILAQVETLIIRRHQMYNFDVENELAFFRDLATNSTLKRLRILADVDNSYRDPEYTKCSLLMMQGITLLIDIRKNDPKFELVLDCHAFQVGTEAQDEHLRNFVSSVVASSSKIRINVFDWVDITFVKLLFVGSSKPSNIKILTEFLKTIEGIGNNPPYDPHQHEIVNVAPVADLLEGNLLPNLRSVWIFCRSKKYIKALCSLPSSVEHLKLTAANFFPGTLINFPTNLRILKLDHMSQPWTPAEWIDRLSLISENCKVLNKLTMSNVQLSEGVLSSWTPPPEENSPLYSFKELKSFKVEYFLDAPDKQQEGERLNVATRNLLLHILQIQRMSLLKFTMEGCDYRQYLFEIDPECVADLLESPLGKSLVKTNIDEFIDDDASESRKQFRSVVQENRRQREEKIGRQGRRLDFFNFSFPNISF